MTTMELSSRKVKQIFIWGCSNEALQTGLGIGLAFSLINPDHVQPVEMQSYRVAIEAPSSLKNPKSIFLDNSSKDSKVKPYYI